MSRALQPFSMSLYALSKSPEYHGSATSDLQNRNKYPFTSKNRITLFKEQFLHLTNHSKSIIIKYYIDKFVI